MNYAVAVMTCGRWIEDPEGPGVLFVVTSPDMMISFGSWFVRAENEVMLYYIFGLVRWSYYWILLLWFSLVQSDPSTTSWNLGRSSAEDCGLNSRSCLARTWLFWQPQLTKAGRLFAKMMLDDLLKTSCSSCGYCFCCTAANSLVSEYILSLLELYSVISFVEF